jgi:hypothetical protein
MDAATETLGKTLDRLAPGVGESFYATHAGFQDPFGDGRRLITRSIVEKCKDEIKAKHPTLDVVDLVIHVLNNVPLLPPPIDADYKPFRNATPFHPHLVCFALAYVKEYPESRLIEPFITLVIRTGWWAGDENCIDDILDALPDPSEACRIAAASLPLRVSSQALFAAGQLLYHLRYGEDCGLGGYVKEQYEKALATLQDPADLDEIRQRLKFGLKPWTTLSS